MPNVAFADIITFTRGSSGTRVNAAGLIETVTTNNPRFDYDPATLEAKGLLIEEQRTNLLLRSAEFDTTWTAASTTVTANGTTCPDGTSAGDMITPGSNVNASVYQAVTLTAATQYRLSIYVKAGSSAHSTIGLYDVTAANFEGLLVISWSGGVPSQSSVSGSATGARFDPAGGNWYRVSIAITSDATTTAHRYYLYPDSAAGTGTVYVWGAQIEAGSLSTSYIPTAGSQVTRSADSAPVTGASFSSWFNPVEGTFVFDFTPSAANRFLCSVNDGSNNNRFSFQPGEFSQVGVTAGNVNQGVLDAGNPISGERHLLAYAYAANDMAASLNGGAAVSATAVTLPAVDRMMIGAGVGGATVLNGHIRSIRYFPERLSNTRLQALSV
ncbi:phage head spike fiber domain-containing protein [Sphingomonas sp. SRS2]|uniref:phage head spike fiber domain-containing protein n=1 Tax=Sphingomonas sp. SRS2 TaxID=133190 RepID=UPI0006184F1F|nr:hypothetical protein [Sphingomonas sp. SRS2]KKC24451.1 hypothetical protein WP12_19360 [Sphingomonas sp. SRS2]